MKDTDILVSGVVILSCLSSLQTFSPANPSFYFPPQLPEGDTETTVQTNKFGTPASPCCHYNHLHSRRLCWVSHHPAECHLDAKHGDWETINSASWRASVGSCIHFRPRECSLVHCFNIMCQNLPAIFSFVYKSQSCPWEAPQRQKRINKVCTLTWSPMFRLWLQYLPAVWPWVRYCFWVSVATAVKNRVSRLIQLLWHSRGTVQVEYLEKCSK